MKLFKSLFLYLLSLTGFLCYGNSSAYHGVIAQEGISVNQNSYLSVKLVYMPEQQWNGSQDVIKASWLQANPEQEEAFIKAFGFNRLEMGVYHIGLSEAFNSPMSSEAYTGKMRTIGHYNVYRGIYDAVQANSLIAGQNVDEMIEADLGMNNMKVIDMRDLKVRTAPNSFIMAGYISTDDTSVDNMQRFTDMRVEVPYIMTQNVVFIENNADIQAVMQQNSMGNKTIMPQISHQFYFVEPIGGGGGAGGSVKSDTSIKTGIYPNLQDKIGKTTLQIASCLGHLKMVKHLLFEKSSVFL